MLYSSPTPQCRPQVGKGSVAEPDWNETVDVPEITGREHLLIKAPNYRKK
ncbi:hypothetical protein [Streptomyces sp. ISL-100]|nr:hypothetical protein [Streptomyces sp. ISL-100]MBT2398743.1 hypothetical protein [Streptomyces sp. ISL-100]